ncbi:hypothetical protein LG288_06175 [Idiomarina seosinensis]|uniref:hypothetical protein n=1 Tax=Idiomarina seosinensis TaxID=281739 RepID=UPI0038506AF7
MYSVADSTPKTLSVFYETRRQLAHSVVLRFEPLLLVIPPDVTTANSQLNNKFELVLSLPDQPADNQATEVVVQWVLTPATNDKKRWLAVSFLDQHQYDIEQRIRSLIHDEQAHCGTILNEIFNQRWGANVR